MHLVIYGPEGSGKGTQADNLGKLIKYPVFTSGDLVREASVKGEGKLHKICKEALLKGIYVPDKQMYNLWEEKLKSEQALKGFILDGFPRNINQARFLVNKTKFYGYSLDGFIYLLLNDQKATERLLKRQRKLFEGSSQTHDTPERIKSRLKTYREKENEILQFFKEKNILVEIDGEGTEGEVFARILNGLNIKG